MILILSSKNDIATFSVCEWLHYFNKNYTIIYDDDVLTLEFLDSSRFVLCCNNVFIDSSTISCFWHRTSFHNLNTNYDSFNNLLQPSSENTLYKALDKLLFIEQTKLLQTISNHLFNIPHLSIPSTYDINRISVLLTAKALGLKTPKWIITNTKIELLEFISKNHRIITKPIGWNVFFNTDNYNYVLYTNEICVKQINNYPKTLLSDKNLREGRS